MTLHFTLEDKASEIVPLIHNFLECKSCGELTQGHPGWMAAPAGYLGKTGDRLVELGPCAVLVVK